MHQAVWGGGCCLFVGDALAGPQHVQLGRQRVDLVLNFLIFNWCLLGSCFFLFVSVWRGAALSALSARAADVWQRRRRVAFSTKMFSNQMPAATERAE